MYGPPRDVPGQCNARLLIGDDYGDGTVTMRCQREPGHEGKHRESFRKGDGDVVVEWNGDARTEGR